MSKLLFHFQFQVFYSNQQHARRLNFTSQIEKVEIKLEGTFQVYWKEEERQEIQIHDRENNTCLFLPIFAYSCLFLSILANSCLFLPILDKSLQVSVQIFNSLQIYSLLAFKLQLKEAR